MALRFVRSQSEYTPSQHSSSSTSNTGYIKSPLSASTTTATAPASADSGSTIAGSASASTTMTGEEAAVDFANKRDALLASIQTTADLVGSLSSFNDNKWTMHYPHNKLGFTDSAAASSSSSTSDDQADAPATSASTTNDARMAVRRAASMFNEAEDVLNASEATNSDKGPSPSRPGMHARAFSSIEPRSPSSSTFNSSSDEAPTARVANHPLSIDLRLGAPGSTSIPALMEGMSQATVAQLLSKRFEAATSQLKALQSRVRDNQSRILVTGDLNAGKSTFVNALLRRDILPTDQQPLTTVFCEVLDAQAYNEGKEEVHAILAKNLSTYSRTDKETYERFDMEHLEEIATSEEQKYGLVKIYLEDSRAPIDSTPTSVIDHQTSAKEEAAHNKSFIRNGIVSISLIDGPGLNKDGLSTTAIFARQTEIDVIVFVVDAYNHFTLSSKEFVWNASMEKAYIFMVINKFKSLRAKEKCERLVGEKIRQLSPKTWENRNELVHFVEAGDVLKMVQDIESGKVAPNDAKKDEAFQHLEDSLRCFLMQKRTISKLAPARHYLINLLSNLATVAEANIYAADIEADEATRRLETIKPIHEKLEREREVVEEAVGKEEEDCVSAVKAASRKTLEDAVSYVGQGGHDLIQSLPDYPGLLSLWDWAETVKKTLVNYLETSLVSAEEQAREITIGGVKTVTTDLANTYLPKVDMAAASTAGGAASAVPQRVFRSEAMFVKNRKRRLALRKEQQEREQKYTNSKSASSALVLSSSSSPDIDLSFLDLFDLERLYSLPSRALSLTNKHSSKHMAIEASSALSVVSLGAGALTMFGSRVVGIKSVIEAITTVFEVLGSKAARKYAGPIAGLLTIGLAAYVIHDLPRAIPHNVGKKLHAQLLASEFSVSESERIATETRKVMRLAGWDLRERFRAALEASEKDRCSEEGKLRKADEALRFLENYLDTVEATSQKVKIVEL